ncbi:hypothetical protein [Dongia sedimenti]|uniref:Cellulose biosynthesis protein BcsF n=1 Tax=Dongia sedimenti TaxID=3064282 RepID=A0ABU0YPT1_9PROT|nr:hypothetical protein [Rhodospirillaceae bacterium R-7]
MLALAEILALLILNALVQAAFARWKIARRTTRSRRPAKARVVTPYPLHPSPTFNAFPNDAAPEHAAHIRPAGIDW